MSTFTSPAPQLYPLRGGLPEGQLKSPMWQQDLGVSLLQQYFGGPDRIAIDTSSFLWNPDPTQSKLFVGTRDNFNVETVGKQPAIIVGLAEQSYPKKVLGDRAGVNRHTGTEQFLETTEGGWEFFCRSDLAQESLSLATEVKYFLNGYRHVIAAKYGFQAIRMSGVGKYASAKEYRDSYGCLATCAYTLEDNFELETLALKVSAFALTLNGTRA